MRQFGRILFVFIGYFFCTIETVDRSNFKTCDESSFCKRHRKPLTPHPAYIGLPETIIFEDLSFVLHLENVVTKKKLKLSVTSYGDSRIGVNLDEIEPIRQRFKVNDSFIRPPIKRGFRDSKLDRTKAELLTLDNQKILVNFDPFRVDILDDNDLVVTLNSQSLLKYEHFRTKLTKPEDSKAESMPQEAKEEAKDEAKEEAATKSDQHAEVENHDDETKPSDIDGKPVEANSDGEKKTEESKQEEGMWDEHYKSHFDSKPYGASSIGMDISLVGFKHAYGLPEHADSFVLKSTGNTDPFRLYNLDVFEYEIHNPMALYGAVPYVVGHNEERTVGVMWLNPSETWIDVKSSFADKSIFRSLLDKFKTDPEVPQIDTHWISETGLIDVYIFMGPKPVDIFRQFMEFFGSMPLPPLFSIGYHQCRWNYNDMDDVKQVDANFDNFDIPYDTLWLDIEHTDGKRYFTWDSHKFNDPKAMIDGLAAKSRRMVTIVDPHIKNDDNYYIYKEAKDLDYYVRNRDGNTYEGWCWCGASMYLDFLNPEVRDWWASQYAFDKYNGTSEMLHIWNDMNEPSVFNGPEVTMYKDNKHYGGWEHREVHNLYGFYNHMATYKGLLRRTHGQKRPFVLTRSFFTGSQRYTAVWTGDNMAEWSHLQIVFPMLLSLSISGIPFVGADVGGFFRNPDEELLVRWYQLGAFNPFFRAHAHLDAKRREPWLFSEKARLIIRDAIRIRYKLLPYWYTLFYEHHSSGIPVLRPLWVEFPKDTSTFSEEKTVMIGSAILARPVDEQGATSVSVYFPGEQIWYDWYTFRGERGPGAVTVAAPLEKIPFYIRGGSILTIKDRIRRSASLTKYDPVTLLVALDYSGRTANGTYYFDDGETLEYQKYFHCYRLLEYIGNEVSGTLSNTKLSGDSCNTEVFVEKIVIMGLKFQPVTIHSQAAKEKLGYYYNTEKLVFTLRKPAFKIGQEWSMQLSAVHQ